MANEIEFDIVAKFNTIEGQLKKLEDSASQTGKKLDQSLADGFEKRIKTSFSSIAKAAAVAGAAIIASLGYALAKSVEAAGEEQDAINRLNQSLANAGTFSQQASQDILDFATQLQATTTIADDAAIGMVALARNFARSNEEAVKLTQAAVELSAATGIGLEQAVEGLGKSLTGNAGRLAQQVPLLKAFSEEQLKAGKALDAVLARFGGSAAAQVNTFNGAFAQLKNTFGDFQEAIGNLIVKSPGLVAAFRFISQTIMQLTKSLSDLGNSNEDVFGAFLQKAVDVTNFLVGIFGPIIEVIINRIGQLARALGALAAAFVQFVTGEFAAAATTFQEGVVTEIFDLNDEVLKTSGTEAAQSFLGGLSNAIATAPPLTEDFKNNVNNNIVAPMDDAVKSVNFFDEVYNAVANRVAISSQKITVAFKQVKQAMFQNLVTGVQSAFSSIGSALVKGENVFAAFGKAILGMFGDIALQLGQFYLLLGIGNLWLNPGAAAGQIAAGIGLSILGGALKALAGGGGGGASAPSTASTGGGVGGGGFSSGVGDSAMGLNEPERQDPGTQVAVNIQGNVLGDKRTLGREIAQALNEAFESDGAIIAKGAVA